MEVGLFYFLAFLCLTGALGLVCLRTPLYSAMSLVLCLTSIAGFFAMLGAHFLAVIQVAVYAGAIMVVILFVIMLLNVKSPISAKRNKLYWGMSFAFLLFCLYKILPVLGSAAQGVAAGGSALEGSAQVLGIRLFTDYVFVFELASVLILAALVGAVVIAKTKE